ncbi:MAG: hypothetical protein Q7R76_00845 [Candidatus Woesearchaeota archaeon]|nr:hypothetical protein [Candidatus Woesearchaeota archaeon]
MASNYATPSEGVSVPGGIDIPGNVPFANDYGAVLKAQLNRIKTTPADFADQHGLPRDYVGAVCASKAPPNAPLLIAIERSSPLSVRELVDPRYAHRVPVHDDSRDGVVICTAEESEKRFREYERGGVDVPRVKYYTYYHTAAQRKSSIIPEKIVEHFEWDPSDPNLPDEYFNNGHRERQMTVVVGDVNYHWIDDKGKKQVIAAHTGDANAISPFTRHSFTVPPGKEGYILAVTDLGAIGNDDFRALAHALEPAEYLALMEKMLPAEAPASSFDELGGFMFRKYDDAKRVQYDDSNNWRRILMNGITAHPSFIASEFYLPAIPLGGDLELLADGHVWGYNHGEMILELHGKANSPELIEPGASFSIQKKVPHMLRGISGFGGQVLIMQSNPAEESALEQLALIRKFRGDEGLLRAASESELWFKEATK